MIIGICGNAPGAGKSTAAQYLVAAHSFTRLRFAGVLKAMLRSILVALLPPEEHADIARWIDGDLKEVALPLIGRTPRALQQTLGTEWGRELVDRDLWVKLAMARAERLLGQGARVVFDDVRFPNEVDAIRRWGGTVIRIVNPRVANAEGSHAAEHAVERVRACHTVRNAGDIPALHRSLDVLMGALLRDLD